MRRCFRSTKSLKPATQGATAMKGRRRVSRPAVRVDAVLRAGQVYHAGPNALRRMVTRTPQGVRGITPVAGRLRAAVCLRLEREQFQPEVTDDHLEDAATIPWLDRARRARRSWRHGVRDDATGEQRHRRNHVHDRHGSNRHAFCDRRRHRKPRSRRHHRRLSRHLRDRRVDQGRRG